MSKVNAYYVLYEGLINYITKGVVNYELYVDEKLFNSFKVKHSKWIDLSNIKPCVANLDVRYYVHDIYETLATAFKLGHGGYSFRNDVKIKLLTTLREKIDVMCFELGYISRKDFYWIFGRELPSTVMSEFAHKSKRYVKAESIIKFLDKLETVNTRTPNIKNLLNLINGRPVSSSLIYSHKGHPLFTIESFDTGINSNELTVEKDLTLLVMKTLYIAKRNPNAFEKARSVHDCTLVNMVTKYRKMRDISTISKKC